jgi:hypothetical protein
MTTVKAKLADARHRRGGMVWNRLKAMSDEQAKAAARTHPQAKELLPHESMQFRRVRRKSG